MRCCEARELTIHGTVIKANTTPAVAVIIIRQARMPCYYLTAQDMADQLDPCQSRFLCDLTGGVLSLLLLLAISASSRCQTLLDVLVSRCSLSIVLELLTSQFFQYPILISHHFRRQFDWQYMVEQTKACVSLIFLSHNAAMFPCPVARACHMTGLGRHSDHQIMVGAPPPQPPGN